MDDGELYKLKIEVWTPSTIPMKRLAQYMLELSKLLGYESSVHFERLEPGSATLVESVEAHDAPKVHDRLSLIHSDRSNSPRDAVNAFARINDYLKSDNASAELYRGDFVNNVLSFPGVNEQDIEPIRTLDEVTTMRGTLLKIGGRDETVPLEIQDTVSQVIHKCETTTKEMAKELAHRLFTEIEIRGMATWDVNTAKNEWKLKKFVVLGFEPVEKASIQQTLENIRRAANWSEDSNPYETLKDLRENGEDHQY